LIFFDSAIIIKHLNLFFSLMQFWASYFPADSYY